MAAPLRNSRRAVVRDAVSTRAEAGGSCCGKLTGVHLRSCLEGEPNRSVAADCEGPAVQPAKIRTARAQRPIWSRKDSSHFGEEQRSVSPAGFIMDKPLTQRGM